MIFTLPLSLLTTRISNYLLNVFLKLSLLNSSVFLGGIISRDCRLCENEPITTNTTQLTISDGFLYSDSTRHTDSERKKFNSFADQVSH